MQSDAILQTIGQIAAALTGFSGVVAVLGHRGRGTWTSEERLQLRTLVEPSLVSLFGSLIPGTLQLAFAAEISVWRVSNGALALLGLLAAGAFAARARSASTTVGQKVLMLLVAPAIVAHSAAAFGLLARLELIFVVGLVLGLVVAAYNFLLLLFSIESLG